MKRNDLRVVRVLQESGWKNARVFIAEAGGEKWVVKDFSRLALPIRVLGRLTVSREMSAFRKLSGMEGVPRRFLRLGSHAFCYRYVHARPMQQNDYAALSPDYFHRFERLVKSIHGRGLVHLDLRGRGNVLVDDDGRPLIVDFGSHLDLRIVPPFFREFFKSVDLSGVYKHWSRRYPLDAGRRRLLMRMDRLRSLWIFGDLLRPGLVLTWGHAVANNLRLRQALVRLRVPLGLAAAVWVVALAKPRWYVPALALSLLGELVQVWCFASLDKNRELACTGPYALTRNPMYIGRFMLLLGMCLLTGNPGVTVSFCVVYYYYVVNRVRREEERLKALFGPRYEEYCRRVPRFLPKFQALGRSMSARFDWQCLSRNHGVWNAFGVAVFFALTAARVFFR